MLEGKPISLSLSVYLVAGYSRLSCGFTASPYFAAPSRLVTVKKGDTATLHCEVHGDKPVTVTWLKGGKSELNPSTNYR